MTADTLYSLTEPLTIQPSQRGTGRFKVTNRSTAALTVILTTDRGATDIEVSRPGDSTSFDLDGVRAITLTADHYPCTILLEDTTLPIDLDAAPIIGNDATNPVFVTGDLGWAKAVQYPDTLGTFSVGQGALVHKVVTARDGVTPIVIVPANGVLNLLETYVALIELPATGGPILRIDAATAPGDSVGAPYSFAIPDLAHVGATCDIAGYTEDPDNGTVAPVGFTTRLHVPRQGPGRIDQQLDTAAGYAGDGKVYVGTIIGGITARIVRATFQGVGPVPVQTAFGYAGSGTVDVPVSFTSIPTPGNLLVALVETFPTQAPNALGIMSAGTLAGV